MIKAFLTACCCLLCLGPIASASSSFPEIFNEDEWQSTLKSAKDQNKLILVDLYTSWCGYCKKMDREVFSDEDFREELALNYVAVKMNAESPYGYNFAQQNQVEGYPTFVVFDGTGITVGKVEGYQPLREFRKSTQRIYKKASKSHAYEKRFKKGKLNNKELSEYYAITKDEATRESIYNKLMSQLTDENLLSGNYESFIKASAFNLDQRTTKVMLQNKVVFIENYGEETFTKTTAQLFNNTLLSAIESGETAILKRMEKELLPYFIDDEEQLPEATLIIYKLYYSGRSDWQSYQQLIEEHWQKNPMSNQVYEEVYVLAQEFSHDQGALLLASKWLTPQAKVSPSFDTYLLLAIIEAIREETKTAFLYVKKAETLAKTEEEKGRVASLREQMEQIEAIGN